MAVTTSESEFRVVLLGNSWSERSLVGNLLLGETVFTADEEPDQCLRVKGHLGDTETVVIINTPDLSRPDVNLTEFVQNCVRLSDPGPHVVLLVLQPEDFTEEHRLRFCRVLQLFSDQMFDQSLVLVSEPRQKTAGKNYKTHPALKDLIRMCQCRYVEQEKLFTQQNPDLLETAVKTRVQGTRSSSKVLFHEAQMIEIVEQKTTNTEVKKSELRSYFIKGLDFKNPVQYEGHNMNRTQICELRIKTETKAKDESRSETTNRTEEEERTKTFDEDLRPNGRRIQTLTKKIKKQRREMKRRQNELKKKGEERRTERGEKDRRRRHEPSRNQMEGGRQAVDLRELMDLKRNLDELNASHRELMEEKRKQTLALFVMLLVLIGWFFIW